MKGLSFRMTITTYYRGFRINSAWDEPNCYPERWVSFIIGWISLPALREHLVEKLTQNRNKVSVVITACW